MYYTEDYLETIDKRIKEDLSLYLVAIEKYDSNQFAICKGLLNKIEDTSIIDIDNVWDENNYVASVINITNAYNKFLEKLPKVVQLEIREHIEKLIKIYFKD